MGKIKILHCIQSLAWGGLEIYTVELIRQLAETDVEQLVLCSAHSRVAEELRKTSIPMITFPEKKITKLKQAFIINDLIQKHDISHLHSHTRLDLWACALSLWNNDQTAHIYNLYMNALPKKDFVHRWLFSKVDALCSSSEFVVAEAKRNFPIAPEKIHLVRYGRQTEHYQPSDEKRKTLRQAYSLKDQDLVFGTLCRIDPGKGVRELVQALDYLSDLEIQKIQMMIVGEPTILGRSDQGEIVYEADSLELANWIDKQAKTPRLAGHLHRVPFQKDYIPVIDILDIFILASYNETYSLSVLDAMLMKKPVIGTDAGGTTEQVGANERGHLIPPKNPEKLAEALRFYINNPDKARQQGERAREWALQQHSWPQTLKSTIDLYTKTAKN